MHAWVHMHIASMNMMYIFQISSFYGVKYRNFYDEACCLLLVAVSHPSKTQFAYQEGTARSELEAQKAETLVLQTPWILLPKTNRNSHLKIGRNYPKQNDCLPTESIFRCKLAVIFREGTLLADSIPTLPFFLPLVGSKEDF